MPKIPFALPTPRENPFLLDSELVDQPFNLADWAIPPENNTQALDQATAQDQLNLEEEFEQEILRRSSPTAGPLEQSSSAALSSESTLAIEALREAQQLGDAYNNNNRIYGARSTKALNSSGPTTKATPVVPRFTPTAASALPRVSGQARGYTLLYLMHPLARASVEAQINTLLRSQINEVYIGVLTDGTFDKNYQYLRDVISRLNSDGRQVTLQLYLTNGPSMRKFNEVPIIEGFNYFDPIEFRSAIRFDSAVRSTFSSMAEEVRPILEFNKTLSILNRNLISIMLEDNLDDESYVAMRQLASEKLADVTEFVRNPCPRCLDGNGRDPQGDGLELHDHNEIQLLGVRDGFSLDGTGFRYEDEVSDALSIDQVEALLDTALERQLRYFALWREDRQGLHDGLKQPDQRSYIVPSLEQQTREVELLRRGLAQIDP
ncbi:MAG: hypothetical protein KDD42_04970 [Bdellovibrionales bacterium]|nr:hypothetical protein [Bdellovibrionales bacterium]